MSPVSYTIEYLQGTDFRKTVISVSEPDILTQALKSRAVYGKEEGALVKALATYLSGHTPFLIEHYKNDERHDTDNGAAAVEFFDAKGLTVMWKHYDAGRLQDARDGEPAMATLGNGSFVYAESFIKGVSQKTFSPQECAEAYWTWAKKHAKSAPAGPSAPGPGSSKPV